MNAAIYIKNFFSNNFGEIQPSQQLLRYWEICEGNDIVSYS